MFYSLHRTYSNIFIIFGSVHNFLHKIKHKSNLHKKEKRHCAAGGPVPRPAVWPIRSAHALRAPSPPVSFVSHAASSLAALPVAVSGVPSPRWSAQQPRLNPATPLLPPVHALLLSLYLGHTHGGRPHRSHIGRPWGLGRARNNVIGSFGEEQGAWCSRHRGGRGSWGCWRRWRCLRAGALGSTRLFRRTCSHLKKKSKRMRLWVTKGDGNTR